MVFTKPQMLLLLHHKPVPPATVIVSLVPQCLCMDVFSSLTTLSFHLHILNRSQFHLDSLSKVFPDLLMKVPSPNFVLSYLFFSMQNTV